MDHEARPDQPRVAEHHGEQPDDPSDARFVGECDLEAGEIDLPLGARRGLEADLEGLDRIGTQRLHRSFDGSIPAFKAPFSKLTPKTDSGKPGIGAQPLP